MKFHEVFTEKETSILILYFILITRPKKYFIYYLNKVFIISCLILALEKIHSEKIINVG